MFKCNGDNVNKESAPDICQCGETHPEAIAKAAGVLQDDEALQKLADLFKTLSDPTRVKILFALSTGELCVCDLAALLQMSQSAISHQLRLLRAARIVRYRKQGKNVFYSLDDDHVVHLFEQGLAHVSHP